MSCHGDPIEFEDLRTPGQITAMDKLGDYLTPDIGKTREPYPGTLSAPYDPGQLAAMNTMMGMGGYGNYNVPQMSLGPGARVGPVGPVGPVTGAHTMVDAAGPPVLTKVSTYTQGPRVTTDARVRTFTGQPSVMSTKARLVPSTNPPGPAGPIGPAGPTSPATSSSAGLGIDVKVWASTTTGVWPRSASVMAFG